MSKSSPNYTVLWYNGGKRMFRQGFDDKEKAFDFFQKKVRSRNTDNVVIRSYDKGTLKSWVK